MSLIRAYDHWTGQAIAEQVRKGTSLPDACRAVGRSCGSLNAAVGDCLTQRIRAGGSFWSYYECAACRVKPGRYPNRVAAQSIQIAKASGVLPIVPYPSGTAGSWAEEDTLNEWNTLPDTLRRCIGGRIQQGDGIDQALDRCWASGCAQKSGTPSITESPVKWLLAVGITATIVVVGSRFI